MNKYITSTALLSLFGLLLFSSCSGEKTAVITTDYGEIVIELLDSTPLHKENFIELVKEGYYDSLTFHRIEPGFVIQGGDPHSKDLPVGHPSLGAGGLGKTIPAEIGASHTYGAVGMARDNNPEKASSDCQFYIVTGKKYPEQQLEMMAQSKNINYSPEDIATYTEKGGAPFLDGEYTVFGYVIDGMEAVEEIMESKTRSPRPEKIYMKIKMRR